MNEKFFVKHKEENKEVWKKKTNQQKKEEINIILHAQSKINQWYIDSGCSKHMIGDKSRFLVLKKEKGGNATFGNDGSAKIIGKWSISLGNERAKA